MNYLVREGLRTMNQVLFPILVALGAKIDEEGKDGYNPLQRAISLNQPKIVDTLLECNADFMKETARGGNTVHLAICHGNYRIINMFVKKNAPMYVRDQKGNTAMHVLCSKPTWEANDEKSLDYLLYHLSINDVNFDGLTPLCYCQTESSVEYLLKRGVDLRMIANQNALINFSNFTKTKSEMIWGAIKAVEFYYSSKNLSSKMV